MSGRRLRLTTSRPAGYRRGGQVIGGAAAPAFIGPGDVTHEQAFAILTDPNIAVAIETEEGAFRTLTTEERAAITELAKDGIAVPKEPETDLPPPPAPTTEPDTDGPQGDGLTPDAKAPEAGGPEATAADSAASAGGAVTPEPTAQPIPPAPEPAAKPMPVSKGRGKAKGTPA